MTALHRTLCPLLAGLLLATGCGGPAGAGSARGWLDATVFARGCPAQRIGQTCGRPFQGTVEFVSGARVVARAHTDRNGRARAELAPGTYTLIAVGLENRPAAQRFTVRAGRLRRLRLVIFNGIV